VIELEEVEVEGAPEPLRIFSLSFRSITVELCSLGASISKFLVEKDGVSDDIVLGYKDATSMFQSGNPVYFSSVVGRVANRIAKGKFSLGGETFELETNNPPNHLHGGSGGFSHKIWNAEIVDLGGGSGVRFSLPSPDGDNSYPGSVAVTATYSLRQSVSSTGVVLRLELHARLLDDKPTPINLSQHSYFNLSCEDDPNGILDHRLSLESDAYTPVDATSIPTREVRSLDIDPTMDWRHLRSLRDALESYGVEKAGLPVEKARENSEHRKPLSDPYGFDHNYVVREQPGTSLPKVASLVHNDRRLTVFSNAPGVQLYTANYLGDSEKSSICKSTYGPWSGICMETQHFPDSVSEELQTTDEFGAGKCQILTPGRPDYDQIIEYVLEVGSSVEFVGSDTEGNKYKSIEEMWEAQDLPSWYDRAKDYYEENCSTTVDGVLGGIGFISDADLKGSKEFIKSLELPVSGSPSVACECGAGIGRVTKGLLLDFCDRCDLVESSVRLLNAAPDYIGKDSYKCRFLCSELQDWEPPVGKYTIIWIQWVAIYLTDEDLIKFLSRCAESLVDGGVIILKENTCMDETFHVDVDDASLTRSFSYWLDLIYKAGLHVIRQTWQEDFPDDIFPVPMLALQPARKKSKNIIPSRIN
jgi:galactose mutarotase-like enzyme